MAYYDLENELGDDESLTGSDAPYSSISNRPPLEGSGSSLNPAVKQKVSDRFQASKVVPETGDSNLILQKLQDQALNRSGDSNIFQALRGFAQGSNTPIPNDSLYERMESQNQHQLSNETQALQNRDRVRAQIAQKNADREQQMNLESIRDQRARDLLKDRLSASSVMSGQKSDKKLDADLQKQFIKLGDTIDPNSGRKGATAKVQATLNAAERVEGLLNQFPDGNIPSTQTREVATAVGALINGGASGSAVSQINELVPHSAVGDAEKIASWITNSPRGAQQQAFIKLLSDTASREKNIAENQIKRDLLGKIPAYDYLRKADPDTFYSVLKARNISPEDYDDFKAGKRINVTGAPETTQLKTIQKDGPPKTKEIRSNGHTYILNEATGKYE